MVAYPGRGGASFLRLALLMKNVQPTQVSNIFVRLMLQPKGPQIVDRDAKLGGETLHNGSRKTLHLLQLFKYNKAFSVCLPERASR